MNLNRKKTNMKFKRAIATTGLATIIGLAVPGIVHAHNLIADGTCQGGVTWNAYNYDKTAVNTIDVTVDGVIVHQDLDFKSSDTGTHVTDMTVPHTWSVVTDAPGTQYDKSRSGSYGACVDPTTTTATPTTVVETTTTIGDTTTVPTFPIPTTTVFDIGTPLAPTTTIVQPPLPKTGPDGTVLMFAAIALGLGIAATMIVRRRPA